MHRKNKTIIPAITFLLIAICAVYVLFLLLKPPNPTNDNTIELDTTADEWNGDQELNHLKQDTKTIAIPGIQSLVFDAYKTTQKVNFFNPEGNDCLFQFTLYVGEKEIWKSGFCESGKGYYEIEISEPLKPDTYNAYLHYGCYRSDGTTLNSANVEFTLYVQ